MMPGWWKWVLEFKMIIFSQNFLPAFCCSTKSWMKLPSATRRLVGLPYTSMHSMVKLVMSNGRPGHDHAVVCLPSAFEDPPHVEPPGWRWICCIRPHNGPWLHYPCTPGSSPYRWWRVSSKRGFSWSLAPSICSQNSQTLAEFERPGVNVVSQHIHHFDTMILYSLSTSE